MLSTHEIYHQNIASFSLLKPCEIITLETVYFTCPTHLKGWAREDLKGLIHYWRIIHYVSTEAVQAPTRPPSHHYLDEFMKNLSHQCSFLPLVVVNDRSVGVCWINGLQTSNPATLQELHCSHLCKKNTSITELDYRCNGRLHLTIKKLLQ